MAALRFSSGSEGKDPLFGGGSASKNKPLFGGGRRQDSILLGDLGAEDIPHAFYPKHRWRIRQNDIICCAIVTIAVILLIGSVVIVGVLLWNKATIAQSTAEMDGMYTMMVQMNNLTETISKAVHLDEEGTQENINTAFLQILDMIDITHGVVSNITTVVEDSMTQVNQVNDFLDSLEYGVLFKDFHELATKVQAIIEHFDENGIKFSIK